MARNLTDLGFKVTVLSAKEPQDKLSFWKTDLSGFEVIYAPIARVPKELGWFARLMSRMYWATNGAPFLGRVIRNISFFLLPIHHHLLLDLSTDKRISDIRPDLIIASGGPWSIFETAKIISKKTGARLFFDYRDAWNLYTTDLSIGLLHDLGSGLIGRLKRAASKKKERDLGKYATGIISVSENTLRNCEISSGVQNSCLVLNGFGHEPNGTVASISDKMNFTFTGTVHKEQLFELLMEGIEMLYNKHPAIFKKIQFNLIGVLSSHSSIIGSITRSPISSFINITPYVNMNESLRIQQGSDVLISIATRGLVGIPGSKIFEYLKANKPIMLISIADDGQETIILKTNTGAICRSPQGICDHIVGLYKAWGSEEGIKYTPNRTVVQEYSYRAQMKILAKFISTEQQHSTATRIKERTHHLP